MIYVLYSFFVMYIYIYNDNVHSHIHIHEYMNRIAKNIVLFTNKQFSNNHRQDEEEDEDGAPAVFASQRSCCKIGTTFFCMKLLYVSSKYLICNIYMICLS